MIQCAARYHNVFQCQEPMEIQLQDQLISHKFTQMLPMLLWLAQVLHPLPFQEQLLHHCQDKLHQSLSQNQVTDASPYSP